jgi:predicted phosphodiesterase
MLLAIAICNMPKPNPKNMEARGKIVESYLSKYDGYGLLTIAKALFAHHPLHFKDVEAARSSCRYYMGSSGSINRKARGLTKSKHSGDKHRANPFNIPLSDHSSKDYVPYKIPKSARKVSVLSDVHVPHHDVEALTAAIKEAKRFQPDTLLLNGDYLDCHMLSNFAKDPEARDFKAELKMGREVLETLINEIAPTRVIYKEGNHEERYARYMGDHAPELLKLDHFNMEEIFGLDIMGVDWVGGKRIIHCGKLPIIHGHEYVKAVMAPVNVARGFFMKAKESIVVGHHHQTSEHTEPKITGDIITAWSVGCLCDLHPKYMPLNRWNHGMMNINLDKHGNFEVFNKRIHQGSIL